MEGQQEEGELKVPREGTSIYLPPVSSYDYALSPYAFPYHSLTGHSPPLPPPPEEYPGINNAPSSLLAAADRSFSAISRAEGEESHQPQNLDSTTREPASSSSTSNSVEGLLSVATLGGGLGELAEGLGRGISSSLFSSQRSPVSGKLNLKRFLNSGDINNGKAKFSPVTDQFGRKVKLRHYCAVRSCPVTEHSRKPESRKKYSFYRIPPAEKDPVRRELWLRAIRPDNPYWDSKWGRVCERHFLSGNPGKTGIPTRFLDPDYPGDLDPHSSKSNLSPQDPSSPSAEAVPSKEESPLTVQVIQPQLHEDTNQHSESLSPQSGSSPPGFCTMHDESHLNYLVERIGTFRTAIGELQEQLSTDESELYRLAPDHPMLAEELTWNGGIPSSLRSRHHVPLRHSTSSGSYSNGLAKKRKLMPTLRPLV